ncbi:MAG: hypothetical protein PHX25_01460 [Candidatus Pacebacteria bacterium]|nr:hypothetical protein [Candidatus Paceibacterota bacterium]
MKRIELAPKKTLWLEIYGNTAILCGRNFQSFRAIVNMKKLSVTSLPCSCRECMKRETLEAVFISTITVGVDKLVLDTDRRVFRNSKSLKKVRHFVDFEEKVFVVKIGIGWQEDPVKYFDTKEDLSRYLFSRATFKNHKHSDGNKELIHELLN